MNKGGKISLSPEGAVLGIVLLVWVGSVVLVSRNIIAARRVLAAGEWLNPGQIHVTEPADCRALESAVHIVEESVQSGRAGNGFLASPLRVVAIGSAFPIPYEAEVCPFSKIPQPAMNQLDRDGDGMTDEWENKYGLDRYNIADALFDLDEDGFTNREEFNAGTDPSEGGQHPPYITKMRFIGRKDISFPLVFKSVSELSDGRKVFQINTPADGKTYFRGLEESVEGFVIKGYMPSIDGGKDQLVVMLGSGEIKLPRGEKVLDPESKGELINMLDRSSEIVTMGALLYLYSDRYTVLGVYSDKVTVRDHETGKVFDVVGFADGERDALFRGFEE